ncbi:fiber [Fowl aviadenovirus 6]|uniref:Fiber n=1 Tax=Fowl aviadenovirus 6 TaxID=172862 RepID=A0A191ULR8_9ADEN|nr:fiber [Fowl aviadenovirus 6]ANJ02463.1 fiber [Fowl aviadenovirus 6]CUT98213.1 fiber protein [Fowl adenovirus]
MATSTPHAFSFGQIGSRKRPAGGDGERDASKVPKMQTPAPSATANGNDELDLVYPFWLQNGSTGGGGGGGSGGNPSLNPPFLDPNGPLAVQNNLLKVNTAAPITVANKAITLAYDPESLELNNQQQLSVKIDPEGPLKPTADGIQLSVDPTTLEVDADDWELTVNLDLNGPLDATASGITVRVDDTLLIEDDDSGQGKELGVNLNPAGPITADQNGLDLEIDDQTLKVNSGTSGGVLAVQIKPQGGLTSQTDGIQVSTQNSITLNNGALDVKVVADGPLASTANGLTLNYDPSDFTVNDAGTLSILRNPSVVANAYLTSGASTLQQFTAQGENSSQFSFPCAYYLQQWLSDGLIFSSLYLKLDRAHFTHMQTGDTYQNAKYFTFWVGAGTSFNLSTLTVPTITPNTTQWNAFEPALDYSGAPPFDYLSTSVLTIYFEPTTGRLESYLPVLTGNWSQTPYNPGTITLCVRAVRVQSRSQQTFSTLVCYNFRCQNAGIFNSNATAGTMTLGPIFFSCPAVSTVNAP